jgi:hypothetical protein
MIAYFVGQYFAQHDKPDLAKKYFKVSAETAGKSKDWFVLLGPVRMREFSAQAAKDDKGEK